MIARLSLRRGGSRSRCGYAVLRKNKDRSWTVHVSYGISDGQPVDVIITHTRCPAVYVHPGVVLRPTGNQQSFTKENVDVTVDKDGAVHLRIPGGPVRL